MLDQLGQLGLSGMAQAFAELEASDETAALTHADWLGLLLDRELTHRRDKRLAARLRYARLRQQASVEDVDYRAPRGLDRALFQKLTNGEWIDAHDNLILCGPTGVGKSWLACALGHKACRDNRSVLYQRVPKLFAELALTLVLLAGAGLMMRSFLNLYRLDVGIDTRQLLTMRLSLPAQKYPTAETRTAFFDRLDQRLAGLAGIQSATIATNMPLGGGPLRLFEIEGHPIATGEQAQTVTQLIVGPRYSRCPAKSIASELLRSRSSPTIAAGVSSRSK